MRGEKVKYSIHCNGVYLIASHLKLDFHYKQVQIYFNDVELLTGRVNIKGKAEVNILWKFLIVSINILIHCRLKCVNIIFQTNSSFEATGNIKHF